MLPTMLVYQDGELVHNWVRVDWEADRAGIEELLVKSVGLFFCGITRCSSFLCVWRLSDKLIWPHRYHILPQPLTTAQNLELEVDDDDDDLI